MAVKIFEFPREVWFALSMAKLLDGNTVVTIQNEKFGTTVFESHDVTLSSLNKGLSYSLVVNSAVQSSESCAKVDGYSRFEKLVPLATQKAEQTMIDAAQIVERTVLMAARNIKDAERAAQKMIDDANAHFNAAILAYLHTGKGNMEATKALEKAGVWATEDRTAAVACFELDKLYGVDTLETGV